MEYDERELEILFDEACEESDAASRLYDYHQEWGYAYEDYEPSPYDGTYSEV